MTVSNDLGNRLSDQFKQEAPPRAPDRVLLAALSTIDTTQQRHAHVPWRISNVNAFFRVVAVAAAALAIIFGPLNLLPHSVSPGADVSPSPSAAPLPPTACPAGTVLKSGDIATIAGTGLAGVPGNGGAATAAMFTTYAGTLAVDGGGAIYFPAGGRIMRIGLDGIISSFADTTTGTNLRGPAIGIAFDANGDLLAMDWGASRIWKIDPTGKSTPIAGTGISGVVADGRPALQADIGGTYLAVGPHGDLYYDGGPGFATVDAAGNVHAFAGTGITGFSGDGGQATSAQLSDEVEGVVADEAGNVYLADANNHRIRKVDTTGVITTVVGTGDAGQSGDGGPALSAQIDLPMSLAIGPDGSLYISDHGNSTIRRVDPAGTISTVAGTGVAGFSGDCGPATAAQLSGPYGIAIHDGILYIVDNDNGGAVAGALGGRIRMVVP